MMNLQTLEGVYVIWHLLGYITNMYDTTLSVHTYYQESISMLIHSALIHS